MAEDWAVDVKKYAPDADDGIIAGIVRYLGIALRKRDSSMVSFSDKKETDRVRENFLKKKLALTDPDPVLDAAIAAVGERMKADRTKNRVTVYYLLADNFGKLGLFQKAAAAAKAPVKAKAPAKEKAPAKKAAPKATTKKAAPKAATAGAGAAALGFAGLAGSGTGSSSAASATPANDAGSGSSGGAVAAGAAALGAAGAAVTGAADLAGKAADAVGDAASAAADTAGKAGVAVAGAAGAAVAGAAALAGKAGDSVGGAASGLAQSIGGSDDESGGGWSWLLWLLLGVLALFLIWWLFLRSPALPTDTDTVSGQATTEAATSAPAQDLASAPAEGSVAIPAGAGVTSELRNGKPVVKVYFASGKIDVAPAFAPAAEGLKSWLASNAGSKLAISGYADPTGNAARNAELSKERAQAVQAALIAAGVPESSAELVKPAESTDATVDKASARRVEVVVN